METWQNTWHKLWYILYRGDCHWWFGTRPWPQYMPFFPDSLPSAWPPCLWSSHCGCRPDWTGFRQFFWLLHAFAFHSAAIALHLLPCSDPCLISPLLNFPLFATASPAYKKLVLLLSSSFFSLWVRSDGPPTVQRLLLLTSKSDHPDPCFLELLNVTSLYGSWMRNFELMHMFEVWVVRFKI